MANPFENEKDNLDDLSEELINLAKGNKELIGQLNQRETIMQQLVAIQQNEIENNEDLIGSTKTLLSNLNQMVDRNEQINSTMQEMKSNTVFSDWAGQLKTLSIEFEAMRQDIKIAGAVFAGSLIKRGSEFLGTMEGIRQQTGMSADQMINLSGATMEASMSGFALGIGFGDAANAASAIYNSANNLKDVTSESVTAVAKLSSWYGVSEQNGALLLNTFKQINQGSEATALSTMKSAENIARAAGVPIGKMMGDVAMNAELFAKYSNDGGTNMLNAAASAAKLGLSLAEVGSISSSLLNVDSSIAAEMEASVLIGKQLNLNRARELALAGDMDGMMKEVLTNVVSINEWESMNVIQREALSDSLGLNVTQMQTMVANQKEITRQGSAQESIWGSMYMSVTGVAKGVMNYKEELIAGMNFAAASVHTFPKLTQKIGNSVSGLFGKIGGGIKSVFSSGTEKFTKLADQTNNTTDAFNKGATEKAKTTTKGNPIVNWINSWKSMSKKALANFALATGVMLVSMVGLAFALKQFNDVPWESTAKGMLSLTGLALSMKLIGNMQGGILKGSIALGIMATSLIPLGYALNMFNTVDWGSLAKGGVALLGLTAMIFGLGTLISSGVGAVIFGAGVIGFIALGGALTVLGAGLLTVTAGLSNLVPLMTQLSTITESISELGPAFSSMGMGLLALSAGLLAITPLLPVLAALKTLGPISASITGNSESNNDAATNSAQTTNTTTPDNNIIAEKLDKLIDILSNKEMTLNLDGRRFGTILGKKANERKVYGI